MNEEATRTEPLTLAEKLLEMQKAVDQIIKDGQNTSDKYDFASDENVLGKFRPLMDELGLLLIPKVTSANIREGTTRSGTARYLTELGLTMTWVDIDSGEELDVPWYAQGVDLAGEKGVGKALTYGEKYFLLKFFHIPTKRDDPDNDPRGTNGEKKQRGTQAAKETADYMRKAAKQMLADIYKDAETVAKALVAMTQNEQKEYAGVSAVEELSDAQLPVIYAKLKKEYPKRMKKDFELREDEEDVNA